MINETQNKLVCLDQFQWQQGIQDLEIDKVDEKRMKLVKTKIQITITQDHFLNYYYNGIILRNEILVDISQNPEILNNVEQIKYLRWQGEYGQNKKKLGKWIAFWNGEALIEVGGYFKNGLKEGLWKQIFKSYWDKAQVYESGVYVQNQKVGMWNYFYKKNKIGVGSYNQIGLKNGKWIELIDEFQDNCQVTYRGVYKNGKKIGNWDIFYQNKQIGGGLYDELGNELKIGTWIEISDGFYSDSQVIYYGEYKNGKKIGGWNLVYIKFSIDCGSYDELGKGNKIGSWIELSDGFYEYQEIIIYGEYQDGKRVGRWDFEEIGQVIGGGKYNDNGEKIGKWIDLSDESDFSSEITYKGQYKKGNKIGKWGIYFTDGKTKQIGGGQYDELDEGTKIGKWIEISENFSSEKKITYKGVYQNGKKVGRWDTLDQNAVIGGGSYDKEGNVIKIGKWIEISDGYSMNSKVTYDGEYRDGQKIGRWNTLFNNTVIGGGIYDDYNGYKIGLWIDLYKDFRINKQTMYQGEYQNNVKIGKWDILYRNWSDVFNEIGGGSYSEKGNGIKVGRWIELSDQFQMNQEIIYIGDYHNSKKVGRWDILYANLQIGGGSYDDNGDEIKIGKWIEESREFNNREQIIYIGEYLNGKKVGTWIEKTTSNRGITQEEIIYDN
ncbi:unnamed protein product [Paramecium pentaurelia]|uniref:Uncharacterized protein n=1 Tax=Paramecium pentaurelia TaxID=43138 RepID=A0A8S1U696_9CILI|nr:unnamed protein product [Paramecium pentaurelia]